MADLRWANFSGADLLLANLSNTHFSGANFSKAELSGANFFKADLDEVDFTRSKLFGANLAWANLSKATLISVDFGASRLIYATLDGCELTGARLWETQRTGWSIKGVICGSACWDELGIEFTEYASGEFERLYSDKTKVVLHYIGGMKPEEIATLPGLVQRLQSEHEGCSLHLKSVEDDAGGATVTIAIEDAGDSDPKELQEKVSETAKQLQGAQQKYLEIESKHRAVKSELDSLQKRIFPLLLEKVTGPSADTPPRTEFLTVMFLDPTGFSKLSDDEKQGCVDMLRGLASPILWGTDGLYINMWGDAVVAGFEDVNYGLECARKFIGHLEVEGMDTRIGMSRGEVRVAYNATTERLDIDGDSVNEGARIEPMAKTGEVLVTEELRYCPDVDGKKFKFKEVQRELTKDVGDRKKGSTVTCYVLVI